MPTTTTHRFRDPLLTLNPEQRRAAQHTEGPVLVLAGAGSGKTRMLVHRIAYLIEIRRVDPGSIVAVTFTNRAADEMRERLRGYVGEAAKRAVVSTFHSLCLRILREHAARLGLPRRFAIYTTADQLGTLRTATAEVSIGDDRFDLKRILRRISDWKTRAVTPAEARAVVVQERATGTRADEYAVLAADAYPRYEEVLRANGAVDFDDLLLLTVRLLEDHEDVRREVWRRFRYIMIDEYQDTNAVQLRLAKWFAGNRRNLCVVGDDDQSIYAFRGADVGNILAFERDFPGAVVVTLEENYRSTQRILAVANAVIAGNPHRHPKRLRTANGAGAAIDRTEHDDEIAEAEAAAQEIATRRFTGRVKWGEVGVLYRTNPQARPIEEAMRARGVPYRVVGGTSFFDRKEVADAIAYLRAVANPADEIAVRRIINYPPRGIGRTTVLRIAEQAESTGMSFLETARGLADAAGPQAAALRGFIALIDDARTDLDRAEALAAVPPPAATLATTDAASDPDPASDAGPTPLAAWAADLFGRLRIEDEIRSDPRNARSAEIRTDNLRDVVGAIGRYERRVRERPAATTASWMPPTLADALGWLALVDREDDDEETGDRVTLMTLHSAKGLEFREVYLMGLEDGLLPHARSVVVEGETPLADPLAEERRLLYVGITRARERLVLSSCRTRRRGSQATPAAPSRFLAEIPDELLEHRTGPGALSAEESADLRGNFLARMRDVLSVEDH
jgi:ATP-dependent DNA helicase Rep/DNA helicase-2/ATP-dependent DNA helicase PcrA